MPAVEDIIKWLEVLGRRPQMILCDPPDYALLRTYIEGYIDGLGFQYDIELRREITWWFEKKHKMKSSTYWTSLIPHIYKGKPDKELQMLLLQYTMDYFKENPHWYEKKTKK